MEQHFTKDIEWLSNRRGDEEVIEITELTRPYWLCEINPRYLNQGLHLAIRNAR